MADPAPGAPDLAPARVRALPAAHGEAGRAAEAAGALDQALAHFQAGLAAQPGAPKALLDLARVLLTLGRLDEAEPLLRQALAILPGEPRALRGLARIERSRGDHAAAVGLLEAAVAGAPRDIGPRLDLAAALRDAGRLDAAEAAYAAARLVEPDDARIGHGLAQLARHRAKLAPAGGAAEHATAGGVAAPAAAGGAAEPAAAGGAAAPATAGGAAQPAAAGVEAPAPAAPAAPGRSAAAAIEAARAAERAGDLEAALRHFAAAAALGPQRASEQLDHARVLLALGRIDEAERNFRDVLNRLPHQPRAVLGLARVAGLRGDPAGAIGLLDAAMAAGTTELRIPLELARLLRQAGRKREAEAAFEAAGRLDPRDPRPLLGRAALLRGRGALDAAAALLDAAQALAPEDPAPRQQRMEVLAELGRLDEAARLGEEGLAARPGDTRLLLGLARVARRRGDLPAALDHLRAAVAAEPAAQPLLLELGRALLEVGEVAEAGALLAAASPATRLALAKAARQHGRPDAAALLLGQLAAAAGEDPAIPPLAAAELQALGHPGQARQLLELAARRWPEDAATWLQLGRLRRALLGDGREEVLDCFRRAALHQPGSAEALVELAREQLALGQLAAAEATLGQALRIDPTDAAARRLAVQTFRQSGETDAALALCDRARQAQPAADWAWSGAFEARSALGDWPAALAVLAAWEASGGARPAIAALRAQLLQRRGETAEAARLLAAARATWPDDPRLWWQQVESWIRHGEVAPAAAALAAPPAFASGQPARLAALRGRLAEAEWRIEDAAAHARQALRLAPGDLAVQDLQVRLLLLQNEPEAALQALRRQADRRRGAERLAGRTARATRSHLGRLAQEYLLDPALLRELRAARDLAAEAQLDALAAIARAWPDHTAPAIALALALRRAGHLDPAPAGGGAAGGGAIPRRITQYWDDPAPPEDVAELMASWTAQNPGYAYRRHDAASALAWLRAHCPAEVAAAFRLAREAAERADLFRLALLAHEGGFYADADDRCLGPLDALQARLGTPCILYQEQGGTLANSFIGAVPGHGLVAAALQGAAAAINRGDRGGPWLDTGPALLTRCFAAHLLAAGRALPDAARGIGVLSHAALRRHVAPGCAAAYKASPAYWQHQQRAFPRGRPLQGREIRDLLGLPAAG